MKLKIHDKNIEVWRKYLGIIYACYCSFGGPLFVLIINTLFGVTDYSLFNVFTSIIFPISITVIYIPVVLKYFKKDQFKKTVLWSVLGILMVFASKVICRFLENNLIYYLGYQDLKSFNSEHLNNQVNTNSLMTIFFILSICLIGPFIEEMTYRVCLFTALRQKHKILAHLITALIFGFQHISTAVILYKRPEEFLFIFSYMGFSLVMTFLYQKTKTPIPGIISHILINCLSVL